MVSSVLKMGEAELLAILKRLREKYPGDPEYADLRAQLPADWNI